MSNYHITQEQALEIANLHGKPVDTLIRPSLQGYSYVLVSGYGFTEQELQAYANAVLDKVLGEPKYCHKFSDGSLFEVSAEAFVASRGEIVYAPKELP